MDAKSLLAELQGLAEKLGVEVVYDRFTGDGSGAGGLCKVKGKWRVIIERRGTPGEKAWVLGRSLGQLEPDVGELSETAQRMVTGARAA